MADSATQQTSDLKTPQTPQSIKKKSAARNPIKPSSESPKMPSRVDDVHSQANGSQAADTVETNGAESIHTGDNKTEVPDAATNGGEDEDDGLETIQVGSVHEGNVVNSDGDVIGTIDNGDASQFEGSVVDQEGDILDEEGNVIGQAKLSEAAESTIGGAVDDAKSAHEGTEKGETVASDAKSAVGSAADKPELNGPFGVQDNGDITDATGVQIGQLVDGEPQDLVGTSIKDIDSQGNLVKASGSIVGKADINPELLGDKVDEGIDLGDDAAATEVGSNVGSKADKAGIDAGSKAGDAPDVDSKLEGAPTEVGSKADNAELDVGSKAGDAADLESNVGSKAGLDVDSKAGDAVDVDSKLEGAPTEVGSKVDEAEGAAAEATPTEAGEAGEKVDEDADVPEVIDLSVLEGKKVNKLGKVVDENGTPWGILVEGDAKKLVGKKVDAEGKIWDDTGKVVGRVELLPESERPDKLTSPFEDFPDAVIDKNGNVVYEGQIIGKLIEGDAKTLAGKKVDADGEVLDKHGNVLGKAERTEEEEPVPEAEPEAEDLSILEGKKVNKAGNVVDDHGKLFGKLVTGDASKLVGKKCDAEGKIWSESGKVIGTAELIPMDDRDVASGSPFEDFPDATVDKNGHVLYDGVIVGRLIEGEAKKLLGKKVDKDGEIVDKIGNVIGKAERWEEEEAAPEPEAAPIDMSALAGKRVNKQGNLVDSSGQIYGRILEGDLKRLVGKMADKNGQIWDEGGNVIGKAELVPESERDGQKEGPFSGFDNPKVTKDGKVADSHGAIIGKVFEGDAKLLYGKAVDVDGDILDKNGNSLGKAERWEEEEKVKSKHAAAGRKVNRKGEVVDENGDTIAKLTDGDLQKCAGNEIDDDGDVVDGKGTTIGHVTLLDDIPEPEAEPEPEVVEEEPQESEAEIEKRRTLEQDKKLAGQMAGCIEQSLDKIRPILKMITDTIETAERQPKEELDEQKLVDNVKPLIEQGAAILQETNGTIRGLDPDGRIASGAKAHAAAREATPEEYRLADLLKELTAGVTQTIENAKKKIAGMPHAKKELNPLWNLLAEPLGQIVAAVGLLLAGVLGLVGKLLSGLGLGGLLDNLLGGLGIKGILKGLGLGMVTESLTGRK